jgi:hypothetical protein
MFRKHVLLITLAISMALGMALALLTGCGQNSSSTGANQPSPTPTPTTATTTGPVTLHVQAPSYQPNETIEVTLSNSGTSTIFFPDHLTNCTVIQLQHQVNGQWENVQKCLLMIATRLHSLNAGQSLLVKLVPALDHPWVIGDYRATLSYGTSREEANPTRIYSEVFQVA